MYQKAKPKTTQSYVSQNQIIFLINNVIQTQELTKGYNDKLIANVAKLNFLTINFSLQKTEFYSFSVDTKIRWFSLPPVLSVSIFLSSRPLQTRPLPE